MAGDLVLVTGATGYLGYLIVVDLLKHGYRVRAAVRSLSKINRILAAPSVKALAPTADQLSFVPVPDMTAPGAYDEAVKGVTYIIHAASPIPSFGEGAPPAQDQLEELFVKTAPKGAVGMLESAHKSAGGTVKRVVMTSSVVAIPPFEVYMGKSKEPERVWTDEDRTPIPPPPYGFEFEAYSASKVAARNLSEAYMKEHDTSFDLIKIFPSWIFGPDELTTDATSMRVGSTNAVLLNVLLGEKNDAGYGGNAVLGQDVARAHVSALDSKVEGNQGFVVNTMMVWEDAIAIAKKYYPEAFADGRLRDDGKQPTMPLNWDSSKVRHCVIEETSPCV
jgi:nucleoside-diphosphate-sugar epimerase